MSVISLSLSTAANHVTTQLFNAQEAHIPYKKDAPRHYNNLVFLSATKNKNGSTNYAPRAIVYDLHGGFGGLPKYEVDPNTFTGVDIVSTEPRIPKHDFQSKLDAGIDDSSTLSAENTKYWTDYNKLIYKPLSLLLLHDWQSNRPYGTNRNFSRLQFDSYSVGWEEYKKFDEVSIEEFRKYLEETDILQGVSMFSDYNSGWGGFSSHLLVDLKDEFFNNGAVNKHNIWVYGLGLDHGKMNVNQKCSAIASFVELAQNLSLFLPLVPKFRSSLLNAAYDRTSEWHQNSVAALLVSSLWELQNRKEGTVSMAEFEDTLTKGTNRNVVSEVVLKSTEPQLNEPIDVLGDIWGLIENVNIANSNPELDMGLKNTGHTFSRSVISDRPSDRPSDDTQTYTAAFGNIIDGSTFPKIMNGHSFQSEFAVTSGLRALLKEDRKFLQRIRHNENVNDKGELVEEISAIMEQYVYGYEDSDEEFDI